MLPHFLGGWDTNVIVGISFFFFLSLEEKITSSPFFGTLALLCAEWCTKYFFFPKPKMFLSSWKQDRIMIDTNEINASLWRQGLWRSQGSSVLTSEYGQMSGLLMPIGCQKTMLGFHPSLQSGGYLPTPLLYGCGETPWQRKHFINGGLTVSECWSLFVMTGSMVAVR